MSLKQRIEQDLKTAMLAGDKQQATTLRGLKSALLYEEVAKSKRAEGLQEAEMLEVIMREAKKRQESADLYVQGGSKDRAEAELAEKKVIEHYLPQQLSESELVVIIQKAIQSSDIQGPAAMGVVIGKVKAQTVGQADGATIARLVKKELG
jgi:uncharacterized protein YqeY